MGTPQVVFQHQTPVLTPVIPRVPVLGFAVGAAIIEEGGSVLLKVKRYAVNSGVCSVDWGLVYYPKVSIATPVTGTLIFEKGVTEKAFTVGTNVQVGTQGSLLVTVKLFYPFACTIREGYDTVDITVIDKNIPATGQWWQIYKRSGRLSSGGVAYTQGGATNELIQAVNNYEKEVAFTDGFNEWTVSPDIPPPLLAPLNVTLPVITGSAVVSSTVAVSNGTWSGSPTFFSRQWQRNDVDIPGATAASYLIVAADAGTRIACWVAASNAVGYGVARSNIITPTAPVLGVPANTSLPVVTGDTLIGSTLTATNGAWTNSPTSFLKQWQRDGVDIAGATGSTYVTVLVDKDKAIVCWVAAVNAGGSGVAGSNVIRPTTSIPGGTTSPFVVDYPSPFANTAGKTIKRPGVAGLPAFKTNGENAWTVGANQIWDLRGMVNTVHLNAQSGSSFTFRSGPASSVVCGGKAYSPNKRYWGTTEGDSWKAIHGDTSTGGGASGNYATMYFNGPCAAGFRAHGFYCKHAMDGIVPQDQSHGVIIENSCFMEIRDDVIQDDSQCDVTFRGCYLQGHVIFSWRSGGDSPASKSGRIVTVENCIIHLDRMMYLGEDTPGDPGSKRIDKYYSPQNRNNTIVGGSTAGMAHKWLHKTSQTSDAGALKIRYKMKNVLIRFDCPSCDGINEGEQFPNLADGVAAGSRYGSSYENVHVCWLGPNYTTTVPALWDTVFKNTGQTKAKLATMGITIHDGGVSAAAEQEAFDYWEKHKKVFFDTHQYNAASDTFKWNRP